MLIAINNQNDKIDTIYLYHFELLYYNYFKLIFATFLYLKYIRLNMINHIGVKKTALLVSTFTNNKQNTKQKKIKMMYPIYLPPINL